MISEFLAFENGHGSIVLYMNGNHLAHIERRLKFRKKKKKTNVDNKENF